MWPIIFRLVVIGVGGYIIKEVLTSNSKSSDGTVDCHNIFLVFHENISIPKGKLQRLIQSRKAIQKRIVDYFRVLPDVPLPKFYIQGSYKMGTMVLTNDGTYDVDLGVYFLKKPRVEPFTLQKWVVESLVGQTLGGVQQRKKCVRVIYQGDFDIDLPVYYKAPNDRHPFLAAKNDWIESDPKEICDWFSSKVGKNEQLLRIVKYFKVWADTRPRKMPSGIAFTVWVAEYYKANLRDDISFYETAKAIEESFWWSVSCENPATPGDDLVSKLNSSQRVAFKDELVRMIEKCEIAIKQNNLPAATRSWKKIFGNRFPIAY